MNMYMIVFVSPWYTASHRSASVIDLKQSETSDNKLLNSLQI